MTIWWFIVKTWFSLLYFVWLLGFLVVESRRNMENCDQVFAPAHSFSPHYTFLTMQTTVTSQNLRSSAAASLPRASAVKQVGIFSGPSQAPLQALLIID